MRENFVDKKELNTFLFTLNDFIIEEKDGVSAYSKFMRFIDSSSLDDANKMVILDILYDISKDEIRHIENLIKIEKAFSRR